MTPAQFSWLQPSGLEGLSTSQIASLSGAQLEALADNDYDPDLSAAQIAAIVSAGAADFDAGTMTADTGFEVLAPWSVAELNELSAGAIQGLGVQFAGELSTSVLAQITPAQFAALSPGSSPRRNWLRWRPPRSRRFNRQRSARLTPGK
jgi:hypothetical protein